MEPDRFDDVVFTGLVAESEPLSPRSHLRRRVAAVLATAIVGFGGLAAAADALTSSSQPAKPTASPGSRPYFMDGDGMRKHRGCHDKMPGEMHRFDPNRGQDPTLRF